MAPSAVLSFRVLDADSGVDLSSLQVSVLQGALFSWAVRGGMVQPGWNGALTRITSIRVGSADGFDVALQPTDPWIAGASVTVGISANDNQCNLTTESGVFTIAPVSPASCEPLTALTPPVPAGWGAGSWGMTGWGGGGPGGGLSGAPVPVVGGGTPTIDSITPNEGTTKGQTPFLLLGTNLSCPTFNDTFGAGALNPTLWAALGIPGNTSFSPPGPAGQLLAQTTAAPGNYGGLAALALTLNGDFHLTVQYAVASPFLASPPPGEVVLAALEAALDAGNLIRLSYVMTGATATAGTLRCEVWKFGIQVHLFETPLSSSTGTLGIMRYFDPVANDDHAVFWLNGQKIYDVFDAPLAPLAFRLYVTNNGAPYNVQTNFSDFVSHTVIVFAGNFGSDVATGVVEVLPSRVRGLTPATVKNWAGVTSVRVSSGASNGCTAICSECFTYVFPPGFVIGRSEPYQPTRREATFTNDDALANPGPNIGFGIPRP